jgi:hypothetical protein
LGLTATPSLIGFVLEFAPQQTAGVVGYPTQPLLHGVIELVTFVGGLRVLFGELLISLACCI